MDRASWVIAAAILAGSGAACAGPATPTPAVQRPGRSLDLTHVSGIVLEIAPDGVRPLPGAHIWAFTSWGEMREGQANGAGAFELTNLQAQSGQTSTTPLQSLGARMEGYSQPCRPAIDRWLNRSEDQVQIWLVRDDVLASGGLPHRFTALGGKLSGVVRDRSRGTPLAGARVSVNFAQWHFVYGDAQTVTDAGGRFTVCGLTQPYRRYWDEGGVDYPAGEAAIVIEPADRQRVSRIINVNQAMDVTIEVD